MSEEVETAGFPDIYIAFDGSDVIAVAVEFTKGTIIHVPVDVLGEAFGRTAAKVFDWCLLDQQAKDCFVFGRPLIERECVPSMRLISMGHSGVWQVWMDELQRCSGQTEREETAVEGIKICRRWAGRGGR